MPFSEDEGADGLILLQLCWVCEFWISSASLKFWPPRLKNLFFYGPLQKHLHTWLLHLLAAFIVHSCHCGCTCLAPVTSHALRKENLLARKDSECTSDLPAPSPSPAWQSKTISSKSSKVKQNVTFHHQSWGILCGECYLWPFTPYHSCIHPSIIF